MLWTQSCTQKTAPSLYFFTDFNNSQLILTRIVSQFRFYIQNLNPNTTTWSASFSKFKTKNWLLFNQFLSDFNDSHVIIDENCLTNQNQNRTITAQTVTIYVCNIEFPRQNWAGWMTHCVIFLGDRIFTAFHMTVYKKHPSYDHGRYDLELGDTLGKI